MCFKNSGFSRPSSGPGLDRSGQPKEPRSAQSPIAVHHPADEVELSREAKNCTKRITMVVRGGWTEKEKTKKGFLARTLTCALARTPCRRRLSFGTRCLETGKPRQSLTAPTKAVLNDRRRASNVFGFFRQKIKIFCSKKLLY